MFFPTSEARRSSIIYDKERVGVAIEQSFYFPVLDCTCVTSPVSVDRTSQKPFLNSKDISSFASLFRIIVKVLSLKESLLSYSRFHQYSGQNATSE